MEESEVLEIFENTNALLEGHFLLSSGLHSNQYFQCAGVLQYPQYAEEIAQDIAANFKNVNVDLVISPAMGGLIIGHEVARAMKTRFVFTERSKENDKMVLRRGFDLEEGEKALIIEDVLTTGGSVREVLKLLERENVLVAGIGFIVDRSDNKVKFSAPKYAVYQIPLVVYQPGNCPLCKKGIPIDRPGSRKKKLI
ncbi:MAG TPA: orotate phosphoribosyltransferase [Bacteroidetes bacterium]|nr:orotate phosphoribosyltransferase [Bacteroidota bacterium]